MSYASACARPATRSGWPAVLEPKSRSIEPWCASEPEWPWKHSFFCAAREASYAARRCGGLGCGDSRSAAAEGDPHASPDASACEYGASLVRLWKRPAPRPRSVPEGLGVIAARSRSSRQSSSIGMILELVSEDGFLRI